MSAYRLIGHFLKENGHLETLKKLEQEYGHPIETEERHLPGNESLESIINDRIQFNELPELENLTLHDQNEANKLFKPWSAPYPRKLAHENSKIVDVVISAAFIPEKNWVVLSTSKQSLVVVDISNDKTIVDEKGIIGRVVIKKVISYKDDIFLVGMDGKVTKFQFEGSSLVKKSQADLHKRLVIDAKIIEHKGRPHLVSIGWDKLLKVTDIETMEVTQSFEIWKQCNCFDVCEYQGKLYVAIGYNDSTLLDVIEVDQQIRRLYKISINDAEFMTSGFSPRSIKFNTEIDTVPLVAIGTSHEPYMRLILVKIHQFSEDDILRNQIVKNVLTMSPQDKFSHPQIEWRAHDAGVWVVGEDGVMRGVNLVTGDVIEVKCHDGRIKTILTGVSPEKLITFGIDGVIKVWQAD